MNENSIICRVCLSPDLEYISLELKVGQNQEYNFLQMFNTCTNLEAQFEDEFPQTICHRCSNDLITTFNFLTRAVESDNFLKSTHEEVKEVQYLLLSDEENDNNADDEETYNLIDEQEETKYEILESDEVVKSVPQESFKIVTLTPSEGHIKHEGYDKEFEQFVEEELASEYVHIGDEESLFGSDAAGSDSEFIESRKQKRNSDSVIPEKPHTSTQGNQIVECKICGKELKRWSMLHHIKRCHKKEKMHLCSSCPKSFNVHNDLKVHMKTHDKERQRNCICPECGKGFFGKQALKVHIMRHMGVRQYQCNICQKKFTTKKSLEVHEFTHNRQSGRFVCKHCDKRFSSKTDLVVHERFHTGDYPYQCEYCEKSYAVKSHYNYHLAKHKGITYKCDQCDKEFMNRGSLTAHRFKHSEKMPHECSICKKGFASPFKLNRHLSCHKPKEGNIQEELVDLNN